MSGNPVNRECCRHIDTRIHCVRGLVNDGVLKLHKVPASGNVGLATPPHPIIMTRISSLNTTTVTLIHSGHHWQARSSSSAHPRVRLGPGRPTVVSRGSFLVTVLSSTFLRGGRVLLCQCSPDPLGGLGERTQLKLSIMMSLWARTVTQLSSGQVYHWQRPGYNWSWLSEPD
eukprot:2430878-Rhodomonas_salina.6